jgi:hypothetical protein
MSDQNKTPPHLEAKLKFQMQAMMQNDGEDEFCDGERM